MTRQGRAALGSEVTDRVVSFNTRMYFYVDACITDIFTPIFISGILGILFVNIFIDADHTGLRDG